MTRDLKVLMISSWYPTRINPTLGNFVEKHCESVALFNKVSVIHVAADHNMIETKEYIKLKKNNVNIHTIYFRKKKKEFFTDKFIKTFRFLKYYLELYKINKKENGKPDIIHHNVLYPIGIIALIFNKFYKIPYVVSEHWTGYLPSNYVKQNFIDRWLSKLIARNASAILPVSNDLREAMMNFGLKSNYKIIHNVTDTKYFNLADNIEKTDKKVILHISSLRDDHKNITGILNVIKKLSETRKDFELQIVGDGDARPHVNYAKELNIFNSFAYFFGAMTPIEVAKKMKEADFLLLFSNFENLPCVIVEALASGLPIVSSTAGGIPEHITEDKGILVEPEDESALFEACLRMLDEYKNYNKNELHNYAVINFSYESIGKRLTDIYYEFVKRN